MGSHYRMMNDCKVVNGITLRKVKLVRDCEWGSEGDEGGYIERESNLQGNAWVKDDAVIYGEAKVYGNALIYGTARVFGNVRVYGNARIGGNSQVSGEAHIFDDVWELPPLQIQGTKHFFNVCKKGWIRIGCIEKTIEDWEKEFKQIGQENLYTKQQIKEYKLYIKLAKALNTSPNK